MTRWIELPPNWGSLDMLMGWDAGRAWVLRRGYDMDWAIVEEHSPVSDCYDGREGQADNPQITAIFADGSLLVENHHGDYVCPDWRRHVERDLLPRYHGWKPKHGKMSAGHKFLMLKYCDGDVYRLSTTIEVKEENLQ